MVWGVPTSFDMKLTHTCNNHGVIIGDTSSPPQIAHLGWSNIIFIGNVSTCTVTSTFRRSSAVGTTEVVVPQNAENRRSFLFYHHRFVIRGGAGTSILLSTDCRRRMCSMLDLQLHHLRLEYQNR